MSLMQGISDNLQICGRSVTTIRNIFLLLQLLLLLTACGDGGGGFSFSNDSAVDFETDNEIVVEANGEFIEVDHWAKGFDTDQTKDLQFVVVGNTREELFEIQPSIAFPSGKLVFKMHPDIVASSLISVVLQPTTMAGTPNLLNVVSFTLTSIKEASNQSPVFQVGPDIHTFSGAGFLEYPDWLVQAHDGDNTQQRLTFEIVNNSHPDLFQQLPSVSYPSLTLRFEPKVGTNGTAKITIRAWDDGGTENGGVNVSSKQTFLIHIVGDSANNPPTFSVGDDVTVPSNSGANAYPAWARAVSDGDNEKQKMRFEITANSRPDLFSVIPWVSYPSKTLRFTPLHGAAGTALLSIRLIDDGADDNASQEQVFRITITKAIVNPQNTKPTVEAMSVVTPQETQRTIELIGSDFDNDQLRYSLVTQALSGQVTIVDSRAHYLPKNGFIGTDSFRYTANDGLENALPALVTINVTAINKPPIATDSSQTLNQDTSVMFNLVATDPEGEFLTYRIVDMPEHGEVARLGSQITYTPVVGYSGADRLTFIANDGELDSSQYRVDITVNKVSMSNNSPTVSDLLFSAIEDHLIQARLQGEDLDDDVLTYTIESNPKFGVVYGELPNFIYEPHLDSTEEDSFMYSVFDGTVRSEFATVKITYSPVNDRPYAIPQRLKTNEGFPIEITLSGVDLERSALSTRVVDHPSNGVLQVANHEVTYTPNLNFFGADKFLFLVNDGEYDSESVYVTIDVLPLNDTPHAQSKTLAMDEDDYLDLTLDAIDVDGDILQWTVVTAPLHGEIKGIAPDLRYIPRENYTGEDSFTFLVNDGLVDSNTAVVNIVVDPTGESPTASVITAVTPEDTSVDILLTGTDPDSTVLSFVVASNPTNGALSGLAPNLTYMPHPNFTGLDSFSYRASDGGLDSPNATVNVSVTPVNNPPTACPQSIELLEDTSVDIELEGEDSDSSDIGFVIVTEPNNGALLQTTDAFIYTPHHNYVGTDRFTFASNDGQLLSENAIVSINVTQLNDAPVAEAVSYTVEQGLTIFVGLSATDKDADPLSYSVDSGPSYGAVVGDAPVLVYTAAEDYLGEDIIQFHVSDGTEDSNVATVTINIIAPENRAPVADAGPDQEIELGTSLHLSGSDSTDADADTLTYMWSVIDTPAGAVVTSNSFISRDVTFSLDMLGQYKLGLLVNDGSADSTINTVLVTVVPMSLPPIANAGNDTETNPDKTITLDGSASESRIPESEVLAYRWSMLSSPDGSQPKLSDESATIPLFQADLVGVYTLQLKVVDRGGKSSVDQVTVQVVATNSTSNTRPIAVANYTVLEDEYERGFIVPDGSESYDPDGDVLFYKWTVIENYPQTANIANTDTAKPVWEFDQREYPKASWIRKIKLVVSDGELESEPVMLSIPGTVTLTPIVIFDASHVTKPVGEHVYLAIDDIIDDDSYVFSIDWTFLQKPLGSQSTINRTSDWESDFQLDVKGKYIVQVSVDDGSAGGKVNHTKTIYAADPRNTVPVAQVADDMDLLLVAEPISVTLDGSLSYDLDGDNLTYRWELSRPDESHAKLNSASIANPRVSLDVPGEYLATLYVSDGQSESNDEKLFIFVSRGAANSVPIASAGTDQQSFTGAPVLFDGTGSSDSDNDPLTYNWKLVESPNSSQARLEIDQEFKARPEFIADLPGLYSFRLLVSDYASISNESTVTLAVIPANKKPTANTGQAIGEFKQAFVGGAFQLDANQSSDPEGSVLTYAWTIIDKPVGSVALLNDATLVDPGFTPDVRGRYRFQLTVNDGDINSSYAYYEVRAYLRSNQAPVAVISGSLNGYIDTTLFVDGSTSYDPDGDEILSYAWRLIGGPIGAKANLLLRVPFDGTGDFTGDTAGNYVVAVGVSDGSKSSTVTIRTISLIGPTPPIARAGDDKQVKINKATKLEGRYSSDEDGDKLTYQWRVLSKPDSSIYSLIDATSGNAEFSANMLGEYRIELAVSDGFSTVTDELVLEVTPNKIPVANAGLDQVVPTGTKVFLNGDESTDPDDDSLTYEWVLSSFPVGGETTLYHIQNSTPSFGDDTERLFYPHVAGEYEAQLVVSDGESNSVVDTVKIQAEFVNHVPVAGVLLFSNSGDAITLSGATSYDVDGDALTYSWRLSKKPEHSNAHMAPNDQVSTSFELDLPGEYEAELIVSDGLEESRVRRWSIMNSPPSANPVKFEINQPDENSPYLGTLMSLSGYHNADYPVDIKIAGKGVCSNGNDFYVNNIFMDYGHNIFGGYLIHHLFDGAENPLEVTEYLGSIESKFYTPFNVDLRNDCGLAPLKTHYSISVIDNETTELQVDYDGDGVVDEIFDDFRKEIDFTYEYPGIYLPTIAAYDAQGKISKHFMYIVVKDPDEVQQKVEAVWAGFTEAVRNNKADINNYLTDGAVQRFGNMLSTNGVKGVEIVDSWENFQKETIRENYAEYSINVEVKGVTRLFIVVFVRTALGSWKVESM